MENAYKQGEIEAKSWAWGWIRKKFRVGGGFLLFLWEKREKNSHAGLEIKLSFY